MSGEKALLGIDSGTSACKVVAFDLRGEVIAEATTEHRISYPRVGWAEQDAEWWWNAAVNSMKEVIKKLRNYKIIGIGVDSQREAVVPISKEGERISRSLIWLDQRAMEVLPSIRERLDESEVIRKTGVGIDHIFSAAKLLWIKKHEPKIFNEAEHFLFPKDYIIYKLTGEIATDYSMASRTMLFNIHKLEWDKDICDALEIPVEKLPQPHPSPDIVGYVSEKASSITGVPKDTPVVGGGGDRPCEALGGGALRNGDVVLGTGTGSVVEVCLENPSPDGKKRADCCCHVIPGRWEYEMTIMTTGASMRWFRDVFGSEERRLAEKMNKDVYSVFDEMAERVPAGSEGLYFYPYFMGARAPIYDPHARGVFYGIALGHRKEHFIRAILEGVAFQYAGALKIISDLGVKVGKITVVGGEAKSDLWNRLKADIMNMPIIVTKIKDAAALGSAILASIGSGIYSNFEEAVKNMVSIEKIYEPDPETHRKYLEFIERYWEICRKLFPLSYI